ncbi:MAG: hypothetical protein ACC650_04315 [Gammaproteobacteria bacterium]
MDMFNSNKGISSRLVMFFIVSLLGVGVAVSQPNVSYSEIVNICKKHTANDQMAAMMCTTCLGMSDPARAPTCKPYLHLKDAIPAKPAEVITPAKIDKEVAAFVYSCSRVATANCQCVEKEYRANRAKGLSISEAESNISSACISEEKIKAYEYNRCVKTKWNMIVEFESFCNCVADHIATEVKKEWSFSVDLNILIRPAYKACGDVKQERLSPEAGAERAKKYGRRGPADISAWRNLP